MKTEIQIHEHKQYLNVWYLPPLFFVNFQACNSRKAILLAMASSPYFSCSCSRTAASPDINRSSSQQCQSCPELWESKSRSRASKKSPLVFSRALVTLTRSWNTNGDVSSFKVKSTKSLDTKCNLENPTKTDASSPVLCHSWASWCAVCLLPAEPASLKRWRRSSLLAAS